MRPILRLLCATFFLLALSPQSEAAKYYQGQLHFHPQRHIRLPGPTTKRLKSGNKLAVKPPGPIKLKSPRGPRTYTGR